MGYFYKKKFEDWIQFRFFGLKNQQLY